MTNKQIERITFSDALKVLKENNAELKMSFDTKESDVRAAARKILRNKKKHPAKV